jgi:phage gpG-like protein
MPIYAQDLIAALRGKIDQCPDVAEDAAKRMSATAQDAIKATLSSGDPLKVRSGELVESVRETYFSPGAVSTARVAPTTIYSRIQELGGISGPKHHTDLPPRPYVRPSILENMDEFYQDAQDAIRPLFW